MKKETRVTHQPKVKLLEGNESLVGPVYRSVKFTFPDLGSASSKDARSEGFDYTRDSNPTTRQLELLAAELQDRDDAICVSTGMAAIWLATLSNLSVGDRIVFFAESYKPTRSMIRDRLSRFGINFSMLSVHDLDAISEVFSDDDTKLVIFESPTNPLVQIPDLSAIVKLAKKYNVKTILDNTFGGLHNHGDYGIDLFVHSLTKYASGHGDVMGGIVIGDQQQIKELKPWAVNMGSTLDPGAAYLILRGLRTYYLRYQRHSETALTLAKFLQGHGCIERVYYPGLEEDPGHTLAVQQMDTFGAVLSFDLRGDSQIAQRFIDELELFATASSIGSTESLVAPVRRYFASDLSDEELSQVGITHSTIRLSVGLEDAGDLISDIEKALLRVFG